MNEQMFVYSPEELKKVAKRGESDAKLTEGSAVYVQGRSNETGEICTPHLDLTIHQKDMARTEMEQALRHEVYPRVSVYGGSKPTEELKVQAAMLGRVLGEKYQVMAGSGGGVPDAILGGAATVSESYRKPIEVVTAWGAENNYLSKHENVLHDVRAGFIEKRGELLRGDVLVVFPGTIGTVAEYTSGLDQIGMDAYVGDTVRPVVFVGDYWKQVFDQEIAPRMSDSAKKFVRFTESVEDVPAVVEELLSGN